VAVLSAEFASFSALRMIALFVIVPLVAEELVTWKVCEPLAPTASVPRFQTI